MEHFSTITDFALPAKRTDSTINTDANAIEWHPVKGPNPKIQHLNHAFHLPRYPMNLTPKAIVLSLLFCFHHTATVQAEERFRILLTNDDGIDAPGIRALAVELGPIYDVQVSAPVENQSGTGSTTSLRPRNREQDGPAAPRSIILKPAALGEHCTGYAIDGTPADAVRFGLRIFAQERPFDLIVSGINGGENLGGRARSSGTIGAAFTGLAAGIPSLAISADQAITNFTTAAEFTAQLIRKIRSQGLPKNVLLSVNIPADPIEGIVAAPMALGERRRIPRGEPLVSETGELTFELPSRRGRRARDSRPARESNTDRPRRRSRRSSAPQPGNTDEFYFRTKNFVTITPLRLDWTDYETISDLNHWNIELNTTNP